VVEKELDYAKVHLAVVEKLAAAVQAVNIDEDVQNFIVSFTSEGIFSFSVLIDTNLTN